MNQPTISIIVNFYNSGKYIPKLLKSLISQSFKDWELIAIDDCSPKHDDEIIYRTLDKLGGVKQLNINIIRNKRNLGISESKLVGLQAARGKYVLYMDGDDWLEKDALLNLVTPALAHDLDLVIGNHFRVLMPLGFKKQIRSNPKEYDTVIIGEECRKYWLCFLTALNINSVAYWAKLYKREVILRSGWEAQKSYDVEDHKFNCTVFPHVKSMMFIDKPVYYWRWGGLTSIGEDKEMSWRFIEKYFDLHLYKKDLLMMHGYEDMIPNIRARLVDYFYWTLTNVASADPASPKSDVVKTRLSKLLAHPAMHDAMQLPDKSKRFEIIRNNDLDTIYYSLHKFYSAGWKRRLKLRIMQLLVNPIGK